MMAGCLKSVWPVTLRLEKMRTDLQLAVSLKTFPECPKGPEQAAWQLPRRLVIQQKHRYGCSSTHGCLVHQQQPQRVVQSHVALNHKAN